MNIKLNWQHSTRRLIEQVMERVKPSFKENVMTIKPSRQPKSRRMAAVQQHLSSGKPSLQRAGLIAAALALMVNLSLAAADTRIPLRQVNGLEGLRAPVDIIKDAWGVSHIYASNEHDLFFAQGYNAARDRSFQLEIWRRRALGTLAEIQGEKALAHDRGARLLRFRGDINKEMAHYHDNGEVIITAFVAGVNAWVDQARSNSDLLPFEFALLGILPGYWTPEVVLSRHNALTGGIATELFLAQMVSLLGAELTEALLPFERKPWLQPARGINLADLTPDLMLDYTHSRTMPAFDASDLIGAARNPGNLLDRLNLPQQRLQEQWLQEQRLQEQRLDLLHPLDNGHGSNNWVIAGKLTRSGKPMMANDPHRSIQNPSLRYLVHLNGPGWNVIGAGEPALPGISIGHNEHGAWGLTIFRIDQEDLFVYETNPDNPNQYRYQGGWRDMEIEEVTINVRDEAPVTATLKYTVHGPVLKEDPARHRAYAMQAAWLAQGAAPYLASLRMDQADSWEAFREACKYSGLPGENMVWADRQGNIGWQAVGFTPVRFGWEGRLPVPGNGEYEWQGFVPIKAMPHLHNPETGFYGTANHNNVPAGYPNIFADFYSDPARSERLAQIFASLEDHGMEDSRLMQYDNKSMSAETLVPIILATQKGKQGKRLKQALSLLAAWDHGMDRGSAAAAIYDRWEDMMLEALNRQLIPPQLLYRSPIGRPKLREWLLTPPAFVFGDFPVAGRDRMIASTMAATLDSLEAEHGMIADWQYGDTHYSQIDHPLAHLLPEETASNLNIGPLPRGGASNTLNANRGDRQVAGASFRIIVDTADWDKTLATNSPGQSGDPRSPHYRNLFKGWNQGDYFPLYYSRDKIEQVAAERLRLLPK